MANIKEFDDIYEYAEAQGAENDAYWGEDLNEEKKARYDRMSALCREIAEIEPNITNSFVPFSNNDRHAMVQLLFPKVFLGSNKEVSARLASLFSETDDFFISALDGEKVALSFCVCDIWNKHGTIYDKGGEKK